MRRPPGRPSGPPTPRHGHRRPPRRGPPGPPRQPQRDKAFEIRKGWSSEDARDQLLDAGAALGPVVLPQSITQEAAEESLKKRFGVDQLPEVDQVGANVHLTTSAGVSGPDRRPSLLMYFFLLIVLVGGLAALYFYKHPDELQKLIGQ